MNKAHYKSARIQLLHIYSSAKHLNSTFSHQMADCAPTSLEDTKQRTLRSVDKVIKYLSDPEYLHLVILLFDVPERVKGLGKFVEIVTKRLYLFEEHTGAQYNYQQPPQYFTSNIHTLYFWLNVSLQKLKKICTQIVTNQLSVHQYTLEHFNSFLIIVIIKLERLFQRTIWKQFM